jgi:acyl transferase domain-containing protein
MVPMAEVPVNGRGANDNFTVTPGHCLGAAARGIAPEPVLLLAGDSPRGILDALERTAAAGPCRLAIVGPTPERLALTRKVVQRGIAWRGRNDVWFTPRPLLGGDGAGRLAFLFPGFEPEAAGCVDDVADHLGVALPVLHGPAGAGPAGGGSAGGGSAGDPSLAIIDQAVDIVTVNRLLAGALGSLGVRPDLLAGHSLGEWTAMIVSGMCDLASIDAFFAPVRAGVVSFPDVTYAALGCSHEIARGVVATLDGVYLSHDNCPHQCVICGVPHQVDAAVAELAGQGVIGQAMPFRSGFHTPLLAPCLEAGRDGFAALEASRPSVPVWSATSVAPYPEDAAALRALVVAHLLEPVRFRELVEALYAEGVRAFVQVGTGSLLGFVDDTLGKREHLGIAAQAPNRTGLAQLARVLAALWVEGAAPAPAAVAAASAPAPAAHPVLAAFEAALADATAAAATVMEAWGQRAPADVPAPTEPPPVARTTTRIFSLETMPALIDHCLFRQAPGWPDDADAFPVVPMTTLLEVMAEAAAAQHPGQRVVAITGVRALRWLAVAPPAMTDITVTPLPDGRMRVAIGAHAGGDVALAAAYPPAPAPARWTIGTERTPPADARSLYDDGWMFHGPGFQGVSGITALGDDGIRGILTTLPASGALLDAAGQLAGHWAQATATTDRLAFPTSIESVRFFGPHPRAGEAVGCAVRVRSFTDETLQAEIELTLEDGSVWALIEGWTCRRFATDEITWPAVHTRPSRASLGEQQPGGWCLVRERWPDRASLEYTMRRYLNAVEREEYERRNPRAQRTWLLGRIAAKDAVRGWLWRRGRPPIYPAEITVGNEGSGRPWVRGLGSESLAVSLAHTTGFGVAIVRPAGVARVGIDIEAIATVQAASDGVSAIVLSEAEHELLALLGAADDLPEAVWLTRFWCAKEAAGKALATGFAGRPRELTVNGVDGATLIVGDGTGRSHLVHTTLVPDPARATHVVAWTMDPVSPTPAAPALEHVKEGTR